jgi:hypothetical protein
LFDTAKLHAQAAAEFALAGVAVAPAKAAS